MHLSLLDKVLWATGFLGHVALFLILVFRHRLRSFPLFSSYILFQILSTALLFADYQYFAAAAYRGLYWCGAVLDFCLVVGVLIEVALHLLRPARRWIADSRAYMISLSAVGVVLALAMTFWVHPLRSHSPMEWQIRANLFTSIVTCELFTAILLTSQRLGVYWRSYLMGLGAGLTVWAILCFVVEGMHAYWGTTAHFAALENARKMAYLSTLVFWITNFWRDEPKRQSISPEMRDAILLHADRVSYDLAQALGTGKKEI